MTGRRSGWMWSLPGKSGASNSDYGGFWMNKLEFQVHVLYRAFHLNMVRFIYLPESETPFIYSPEHADFNLIEVSVLEFQVNI